MITFIQSHLYFKRNIFVFSCILFSLLVVLGTLSHEIAHIIVAKMLGFEATLHYGSMSWFVNGVDANLMASKQEIFLVTLGGVVQTVVSGIIGVFILYFSRSKLMFWLGIALTLFWSRQIVNLIVGVFSGIFLNKAFFGGDELILAQILGLPNGFFSITLALFGFLFCFYAVYKIKKNNRLSFILGGMCGGIITYILWFGYLGKLFLP